MKKIILVFQLLVSCLLVGQHTVHATEVESSYYFPGSSTTFATGVEPVPGFMLVNEILIFK